MSAMNEQQLRAVDCQDDRILCLAGAGTGKTTSMLERISKIVSLGTDPRSILVLTFTNAAAFEMKDRYKRKHSTTIIPDFRTFHSFCYWVLSNNEDVRKLLGYTAVPRIADDMMAKKILRDASNMLNIKPSSAKDKHRPLTPREKHDMEIIRKEMSRIMKRQNLITFDDLCSEISKLFTNDVLCIGQYKDRYKYIFVDEFQDTDEIQYQFVESFKDAKIFVVGDALQAIYGFRGADSTIIKNMSEDPRYTVIKLYKNYRSTPYICNFANNHSKHAKDSYRVEIESARDNDAQRNVIHKIYSEFTNRGQVNDYITTKLIEDVVLHSGSTAILCRTNSEVNYLCNLFTDKGLAYRTSQKNLDVKNILTSIGNNDYLIDWLASYMNADRYSDYIRVTTLAKETTGQDYTLTQFFHDFGDIKAISERWILVRDIRRICKDSNQSVLDRCEHIKKMLDCDYLEIDPVDPRLDSMKTGVDYLLDLYLNYSEAPGKDVYIGTIHSVKGLEFSNVYVIGVNDVSFPLNNEENKNLYYVAITRAKDYLVIYEKDRY